MVLVSLAWVIPRRSWRTSFSRAFQIATEHRAGQPVIRRWPISAVPPHRARAGKAAAEPNFMLVSLHRLAATSFQIRCRRQLYPSAPPSLQRRWRHYRPGGSPTRLARVDDQPRPAVTSARRMRRRRPADPLNEARGVNEGCPRRLIMADLPLVEEHRTPRRSPAPSDPASPNYERTVAWLQRRMARCARRRWRDAAKCCGHWGRSVGSHQAFRCSTEGVMIWRCPGPTTR